MGGHSSGVSQKLRDWTAPPATTRRKLGPGRRNSEPEMTSSPNSFSYTDFPGARGSKSPRGEAQPPRRSAAPAAPQATDGDIHSCEHSHMLPQRRTGAAPCPSTRAAVPPRDAAYSRPADTRPFAARDGTLRQANESSHPASERTSRRLLSSAPQPQTLPASQIPRLTENAPSPFSHCSTVSCKVPAVCPSAPGKSRRTASHS